MCLFLPFALGGDIWLGPNGADNWDGNCGSSPTCSQTTPCLLKPGTGTIQTISTVDGPICTLHLQSGDYGTAYPTISLSTSQDVTMIVTSDGIATAKISIDAGAHPLVIRNLRLASVSSAFSSTNETELIVEHSHFEVLDSAVPTLVFSRGFAPGLSTFVNNCTFTSTSQNIYAIAELSEQNLRIVQSTFTAAKVALLISAQTIVAHNCTFNTPGLFKGEAASVELLHVLAPVIQGYVFSAISTLNNLTMDVGSVFSSASLFGGSDFLLEEPALNSITSLTIRDTTFGTGFSLGNLQLGSVSQVTIEGSTFDDGVGSFSVQPESELVIRDNSMKRKYDGPILEIISVLNAPLTTPIVLTDNAFAREAEGEFLTPTISLRNATTFDASSKIAISSLGLEGEISIDGSWEVQNWIGALVLPYYSSQPCSLKAANTGTAELLLWSVEIFNVSIDFRTGSLAYKVTNASRAISGPNTSMGYFIYISSPISVDWDEKSVGFLPALEQLYIVSSSLDQAPSSPYTQVGARFNYTVAQGSNSNSAVVSFNRVTCPSQCDPLHSLPACVAVDKCSCTAVFSGPFCKCNATNLPNGVECAADGSSAWTISSPSSTIATISIPSKHSLIASGDLIISDALNLPSETSLVVVGALRIFGKVSISSRVLKHGTGTSSCVSYTDMNVTCNSLTMESTARVSMDLQLNEFGAEEVCGETNSFGPPTFQSISSAASLAQSAAWTIKFSAPSASNRRADLTTQESLAQELSLRLRLLSSPSSGATPNPPVTVQAPPGSCATAQTSTPGSIDVSVQACPPTQPSANSPGKGPNSKSSKILWWYWGIPVIVVGAILIILLIVLIAVRPCCKK